MLKRNGQVVGALVRGSTLRLTESELEAYTASFATIRSEFDEMRLMQQQVRSFPHAMRQPAVESLDPATTITVEGTDWQTQTQLLKLPKSEIYLCQHPTENEFAIIQRFPSESAYATANGEGEVLLRGDDPRQLVSEHAKWAQHTLRFMASNLVARAQRVAFERFPEHNPGRVTQAISERCLSIVGESVTVTESVNQTTRQTRGIRI